MATSKKSGPKKTAGSKNGPPPPPDAKPARSPRRAASASPRSDPRSSGGGPARDGYDETPIYEFLKLSTGEMAAHLFAHPEAWLDSPHPVLGGRTPNQLIASGEEQTVRDLLAAATLGLFW